MTIAHVVNTIEHQTPLLTSGVYKYKYEKYKYKYWSCCDHDQSRPLSSHPAGSFSKQTLADTLTVDIGQMLEKYRLYTQEYFQKRTQEESKYRKSDDQQTDLLTLWSLCFSNISSVARSGLKTGQSWKILN